ncbi:MAG: DUF4143 domain-containing protein [Planctomycetes bacterium]|nr:DUF4143 domain-containing protein [Planctomycetota bacterium]
MSDFHHARVFYYRTHTGDEVDFIVELRGERIPIEIKLGVSPPDLRGLRNCMAALKLRRGFVVNLASKPVDIVRGVRMCGLVDLLETLGLRPNRALTKGAKTAGARRAARP